MKENMHEYFATWRIPNTLATFVLKRDIIPCLKTADNGITF
jgi:hypothetical protein